MALICAPYMYIKSVKENKSCSFSNLMYTHCNMIYSCKAMLLDSTMVCYTFYAENTFFRFENAMYFISLYCSTLSSQQMVLNSAWLLV